MAGRKGGGATRSALAADIIVDWAPWSVLGDLEGALVRPALGALAAELDFAGRAEISVMFTEDAALRALNARWRGQDKPTNVLSFPADPGPFSAGPRLIGDVAIAFGVAAREAALEGKSLHHHVTHLVVHGALHLLGYDHESAAEAEAMEATERAILARLGIPDPYADQDLLPA
jgi:probable rRNA maturation factor